jgi:hypothetical protein
MFKDSNATKLSDHGSVIIVETDCPFQIENGTDRQMQTPTATAS